MSVQLYYEEKGNGEPLILLHGNGESHEYFVHQIEYFSQNYRVIAIDTRGHGKSMRGDTPFTIRQFALDLHCFMEDLGIQKSNILGFSDGGNIALIFALTYPEQVMKLILNGANLFGRGIKPHIQILESSCGRMSLMVNDPDIRPQELSRITARTLVIAGTGDMIKTAHTRLIYENLPDAELVFIRGNHFIANRKFVEFNKEVERFLQEAGGRP